MLRFSRMTAVTPSDVLEESTQVIRMLKNGEDLSNFDAEQGYTDNNVEDEEEDEEEDQEDDEQQEENEQPAQEAAPTVSKYRSILSRMNRH